MCHAIAAEIPSDIAPKTLFHEIRDESDSELESESESLVSGSGSELRDACWGGAMRLGAESGEIFVGLNRGPAGC